jgi:kynurenine formamidase
MKVRTLVIGYCLALALILFAKRHPDQSQPGGFRGVVDLTHSLAANQVAHVNSGLKDSPAVPLPGTQIDAPALFTGGGWTVGRIPPERLIAPLVILDLRTQARSNPDYQLSVEDISRWEKANGQIPFGSVVMALTGWETRWYSPEKYRNADSRGAMHFPGFSLDAVRFLVEARNTLGLGIDTESIDQGAASVREVRQYALAHGLYHLENVTNLEQVPPVGAVAVVAPTKLENSASGPVRVMALLR